MHALRVKNSPVSSLICSKLPYSWKFSPGENFHQFRHLLLLAKFLSENFLSCVNDYREDMLIFTTLAKIYSTEYFCNRKVAGLGEYFQRKFSAIRYYNTKDHHSTFFFLGTTLMYQTHKFMYILHIFLQ